MLIDRFGARRLVQGVLVPFMLALVVLNLGDQPFLAWLYLMLLGLSIGLFFTSSSALWAELYGTSHLGAIKSLVNAVMVFSSALGPALMGSMLERGFSLFTISACAVAFMGFALAALVLGLRHPGKHGGERAVQLVDDFVDVADVDDERRRQ